MGRTSDVTVLVVDDFQAELTAIEQGLSALGMAVLRAGDKRVGLKRFFAERPDAVVIDCTADGMPPFELCERLRELSEVPILIIAPPSEPDTVIGAFDAGADDFVARPVDPEEIAVRLRAVLRRARPEDESARYVDDNLELDFDSHEARTPDGTRVELTPLQFRLLSALVRNRHQVLAPQQLLELAWGPGATSLDRVKVQISNLRDRLSRAGVPGAVVQTVAGVGYRYQAC